jgi:hypothetical protein
MDKFISARVVNYALDDLASRLDGYKSILRSPQSMTKQDILDGFLSITHEVFSSPIEDPIDNRKYDSGLSPKFIGLYDLSKHKLNNAIEIPPGDYVVNPRSGWYGPSACQDLSYGAIMNLIKGIKGKNIGNLCMDFIEDVEEAESINKENHISCTSEMIGAELVIGIPSHPFEDGPLKNKSFYQTVLDWDLNYKKIFNPSHLEKISTILEPWINYASEAPRFTPDKNKVKLIHDSKNIA